MICYFSSLTYLNVGYLYCFIHLKVKQFYINILKVKFKIHDESNIGNTT